MIYFLPRTTHLISHQTILEQLLLDLVEIPFGDLFEDTFYELWGNILVAFAKFVRLNHDKIDFTSIKTSLKTL